MSDTQRVQRWRERMREEGKEPISLWLSRDAKLRLEDMAALWRCSPSDLVEQALAQFRPGNPSVPGTVPDTSQLQTLLAEASTDPAARAEVRNPSGFTARTCPRYSCYRHEQERSRYADP